MQLGAIHTPAPPAVRPLAVRAALAALQPPARADWFARCPADGDALGNLEYGCCVPAAEFQAIRIRRANAWDDSWKPERQQVLALYSRLTGFDPATGQPDAGTDTAAAMTAWCQTGIAASDQALDVVHWATVDPMSDEHVALAIAHTGPVQATLALPTAAQDVSTWAQPPGSGRDWAPASWGYHRVVVAAYDGRERVCRTWGQDQAMHPDWWGRYVVAVDATLSRQWMDAAGTSPAGLNWIALEADMARLAA